jgi:hypothetical protein
MQQAPPPANLMPRAALTEATRRAKRICHDAHPPKVNELLTELSDSGLFSR